MHRQQDQTRDKEEYTIHYPKRKARFEHRARLVRMKVQSTRATDSIRS